MDSLSKVTVFMVDGETVVVIGSLEEVNSVFNSMIEARELNRFQMITQPNGMRVFINPDHVMRMVEE
jgi:uncharacterized protein YlzI (FlbEa/FlbD family)